MRHCEVSCAIISWDSMRSMPEPERDFQRERTRMVATQIAARGVKDPRVLAAMKRVPRERFLLLEDRGLAHEDHAVAIGRGQTLSQPYMVAKMTEELCLTGSERVLEIGTGSGYQTAILAELAAEIFTVERIEELSLRARHTLEELGYRNIRFRVGDGSQGWGEFAPYERILVTAGAPELPPSLVAQLAPGGILAIPVGDERSQILTIVSKTADGRIVQSRSTLCTFVKLIGQEGWTAEK